MNRKGRALITALATATLLMTGTGTSSADEPTPAVVAGPNAAATGYATPAMAVVEGSSLDLVSADLLVTHDVVQDVFADEFAGPDDNPWCITFPEGKCPLFWSRRISALPGSGGPVTPVLGVDTLDPGQYSFFCTIHPGMQGTLVVVGA